MTFAAVVDVLRDYGEQVRQCQAIIGQEDIILQLQALQQIFDHRLRPQVIQAELLQPQGRSAITEMHRHMRLLAIDVRFLQSARQPQTYQQRLGQIEQRLQQLQGFTEVLITLCEQ